MNWDSFLDDLAKWLDQRELLNPRASWVVGASGGLDSTLLLHAMKALSEQRELSWKLHAAHLNHGLRGAEAEDDQQFVSELAEQLGVVFHVERADIQNHLKKQGGSTEEVARRKPNLLDRLYQRTLQICGEVSLQDDILLLSLSRK